MAKTSMGLDENVAGLLCYVAGWISGLIFLLLENENKYVRFHAIQSIAVFATLNVVAIALYWIPFVGGIIGALSFVLWIVLMVKAYQGQRFKMPVAGDLAEKRA